MSVHCAEIVEYAKGISAAVKVVGETDRVIDGFCSLNVPKSNAITWIKHPEEHSLDGFAGKEGLLIVSPHVIDSPAEHTSFLLTDTPKALFFSILHHFWAQEPPRGIAGTATVNSRSIAQGVSIGEYCYIGPEVVIGENTIIEHNVSLRGKVIIGANCIIHSGAVIGSDGFGYFINENGRPEKVEHFGGVMIGEDVEVGANTCIDRGTIDDTVIGAHTKIDNLCHIAHNVRIGESCMIIAQSLIAGSVQLGKGSYIAPGAIVKNQLTVGENAFVGMGAVVVNNVEPDMVVAGVPARVIRKVGPSDK
ncbi:UDP-3-O-(3-hydroxymyristoyl)glucosamine N-acyltransferase [Anaerofilum sp. BX8]|uniref:UDP-3-O-(3-hydroxymyristoyl)glucosamine N-acyltransferase n=1 Tax=Anaerofilum hominis TaxID=2763016 RepID=A0A923I930_9FIRM|nr:UDP-3-O-(3-hydroxymyristoyl)glucosamine N-acyltransferase [Anaerofilum hominis]MBC5581187.1 UDP-3-O-(3-hydroxymyristoyl)glucosamine N-acyltransferase [Anaerofilum hominis]